MVQYSVICRLANERCAWRVGEEEKKEYVRVCAVKMKGVPLGALLRGSFSRNAQGMA